MVYMRLGDCEIVAIDAKAANRYARRAARRGFTVDCRRDATTDECQASRGRVFGDGACMLAYRWRDFPVSR